MKLTVDEILSRVKTFAHDNTLSAELIYDFINMALHDIEAECDYNFQVIRDETVTVTAGTQTISTVYDVKRIVEVDPDDTEMEINAGNIQLTTAPDEDTDITITYIKKIPKFDGSSENNVFPDSYLLVTGAVFYALMFNNQPESTMYQNLFYQKLKDYAEENAFMIIIPEVEDITNLGI